jgi:hypothetical protein
MFIAIPIWLLLLTILLFARGKSGEEKWLERKKKEHIRQLMDDEQQEYNERNVPQSYKHGGLVMTLLFAVILGFPIILALYH